MERVFCRYQHGNRTWEINHREYTMIKDNGWLNDQHMDIFMKWVLNTTLTPSQAEQVHIFNAQFYAALKLWNKDPSNEENIGRLQRATRKIDLSKKALVLLPVIEENHWTLGVVSKGRIIFFDSLRPHNLETPAGYIANLYKFMGYPFEENALVYARCPQQDNTIDCGIYTIRHTDYCMKRFSTGLNIQLPPEEVDMTQCHIGRQLLAKVAERWSKRNNNQIPEKGELEEAKRTLINMRTNWRRGRSMKRDLEIGHKLVRLTLGRAGKANIKFL